MLPNCTLSEWSAWSVCSATCGVDNFQTASRSIIDTTLCRHSPLGKSISGCNNATCPFDCAVSDWVAWSTCSKTCGGGTHLRSRTVTGEASHGGKACPHLAQTELCNAHVCGRAVTEDELTAIENKLLSAMLLTLNATGDEDPLVDTTLQEAQVSLDTVDSVVNGTVPDSLSSLASETWAMAERSVPVNGIHRLSYSHDYMTMSTGVALARVTIPNCTHIIRCELECIYYSWCKTGSYNQQLQLCNLGDENSFDNHNDDRGTECDSCLSFSTIDPTVPSFTYVTTASTRTDSEIPDYCSANFMKDDTVGGMLHGVQVVSQDHFTLNAEVVYQPVDTVGHSVQLKCWHYSNNVWSEPVVDHFEAATSDTAPKTISFSYTLSDPFQENTRDHYFRCSIYDSFDASCGFTSTRTVVGAASVTTTHCGSCDGLTGTNGQTHVWDNADVKFEVDFVPDPNGTPDITGFVTYTDGWGFRGENGVTGQEEGRQLEVANTTTKWDCETACAEHTWCRFGTYQFIQAHDSALMAEDTDLQNHTDVGSMITHRNYTCSLFDWSYLWKLKQCEGCHTFAVSAPIDTMHPTLAPTAYPTPPPTPPPTWEPDVITAATMPTPMPTPAPCECDPGVQMAQHVGCVATRNRFGLMAVVVHHRAHQMCHPLERDPSLSLSMTCQNLNRGVGVGHNCKYMGSHDTFIEKQPRSCADIQSAWDKPEPPANGEYYMDIGSGGSDSDGGVEHRTVKVYCDMSTTPATTSHRCQHCSAVNLNDHRVWSRTLIGKSNYVRNRTCTNPFGLTGTTMGELVQDESDLLWWQSSLDFVVNKDLDQVAQLTAKCQTDCEQDPNCRAVSCTIDQVQTGATTVESGHTKYADGTMVGDTYSDGDGNILEHTKGSASAQYARCYLFEGNASDPCNAEYAQTGNPLAGFCQRDDSIIRGGPAVVDSEYYHNEFNEGRYENWITYAFDDYGTGYGQCYHYNDVEGHDSTVPHGDDGTELGKLLSTPCCEKMGMDSVPLEQLSAAAQAYYIADNTTGAYGASIYGVNDYTKGNYTHYFCVPRKFTFSGAASAVVLVPPTASCTNDGVGCCTSNAVNDQIQHVKILEQDGDSITAEVSYLPAHQGWTLNNGVNIQCWHYADGSWDAAPILDTSDEAINATGTWDGSTNPVVHTFTFSPEQMTIEQHYIRCGIIDKSSPTCVFDAATHCAHGRAGMNTGHNFDNADAGFTVNAAGSFTENFKDEDADGYSECKVN